MKRERPPQPPLSVRVKVAERQLVERGIWSQVIWMVVNNGPLPLKHRLAHALNLLYPNTKTACDHNPALILREYNPKIKNVAARYTPHAHDTDYLRYISTGAHHIKTNVTGDGAQRSDTSERMHRRRMEENRGLRKRKPKSKIPARKNPWPKGQKIRSRGFRA